MAVNVSGLEDDLLSLFTEYPATTDAAAEAWASAVIGYASSVVPIANPAGVAAAGVKLESDLKAAYAKSPLPTLLTDMETAFATFAVAVGGAMAPAYTAVPPPLPVGFLDLGSVNPPPATPEEAAELWTNKIDTWFKTGTATPSAGGPPENWS